MSFVVNKNGFYEPSEPHACKSCGATDMLTCYPDSYPRCGRCGGILMYLGRVPRAECVTPNGRVDGHGMYVRIKDGRTYCDFCKKPLT